MPKVKTPPAHDIDNLISTWTDQQVRCRSAATHAWLDDRWQYVRAWGYFHITTPCARGCGVVRHQQQDAEGYIIGRPWLNYDGAEGYLASGGRITPNERAHVRRAVQDRVQMTTTTRDEPPRYKVEYAKVQTRRRGRKAS